MTCKLGITSMSLGWASAGHTIEDKLELAHQYGYQGIELFWSDLDDLAQRRFKDAPHPPTDMEIEEPLHGAHLLAARYLQELCQRLDIHIICLQPFAGYEGLADADAQDRLKRKLLRWMDVADTLHTDMIQIPSSFAPADALSTDLSVHADGLRTLGDMGGRLRAPGKPKIRFVYEALCFGTVVDRWEASWEVVQQVDRANVGLCLDSFNIAGRIYADPTSPTGTTPDAEEAVRQSMARLLAAVDPLKVFYVQIVDAERLRAPLATQPFYDAALVPRMNWSRNCRLFYGERDRGAYLPVRQIAETLFHRLGFAGWVSLELFHRRMRDEGAHVREELARRGAVSWARLVRDLHLATDHPPTMSAVVAAAVEEEEEEEEELVLRDEDGGGEGCAVGARRPNCSIGARVQVV